MVDVSSTVYDDLCSKHGDLYFKHWVDPVKWHRILCVISACRNHRQLLYPHGGGRSVRYSFMYGMVILVSMSIALGFIHRVAVGSSAYFVYGRCWPSCPSSVDRSVADGTTIIKPFRQIAYHPLYHHNLKVRDTLYHPWGCSLVESELNLQHARAKVQSYHFSGCDSRNGRRQS